MGVMIIVNKFPQIKHLIDPIYVLVILSFMHYISKVFTFPIISSVINFLGHKKMEIYLTFWNETF